MAIFNSYVKLPEGMAKQTHGAPAGCAARANIAVVRRFLRTNAWNVFGKKARKIPVFLIPK